LDYYANYYWKVVEMGDTCNSEITFSFRTEHEPNSQAGSDTLYPQNAQFWTGTTEGTVKIDGGINTVYQNVGWAVFDISSIPANAVINGITFRGYVCYTNFPFWSATPMETVNPVTDDAEATKDQILANYNQNIAYIYSDETLNFTTGWHAYQLGNNAVPVLQNAVTSSQGCFGLGIVDRDFSEFYQINFEGWLDPNPPCIIVDYKVTPVELISFTANANEQSVLISWQTATEDNNKGFEVQRQRAELKEHSKDANWEKIGFVSVNGSSTQTHSYSFTDKNVNSGKYYYCLKQVDFDGTSDYSTKVEVNVDAPAAFALQQNYPNPFNPTTMIQYSIPADQHVKLNVYNLLGTKVITLVVTKQKSGRYEVSFNASGIASGVYFYKLEAGKQTSIKKMILMK
jgi:Secretion system C-terminal sorting domain